MKLPWAKCIRRLPSDGQKVFLSFDDGPDPNCTPQVLDVLAEHRAKATFFVIAQRAQQQRGLLRRILDEGHTVGNHSLDHNTWRYFATLRGVHRWLQDSETMIEDMIGQPSVGFRSPAGVRTPWLHVALANLQVPWVHWSMRFYDTALPWTAARSQAGALRLRTGDIVLLHDTHKGHRRGEFLASLEGFVTAGQQNGFEFSTIRRTDALNFSLAENGDAAFP